MEPNERRPVVAKVSERLESVRASVHAVEYMLNRAPSLNIASGPEVELEGAAKEHRDAAREFANLEITRAIVNLMEAKKALNPAGHKEG
jgi:hypothetical protein